MLLANESELDYIIFDGAMGTMLQRAGLEPGELPEVYNIEKPEIIKDIHKSYIRAGAQVITTNTFQANEIKLEGSPYTVEQIIEAGVKLAKEAGAPYVALDMGPLGQMLEPLGDISFEKAYQLFKRQVVAGAKAGADCILIETLSDLYEAKAALLAAKENSNLPVFCTMTFQRDGRTFLGTDPLTATLVLQSLGADALGINCSLGPKEIRSFLPPLLEYARVPIIIQPNAGLPLIEGGETVFPVKPEAFGAYAREMAMLGVKLLGGCCGTTPEHIQALKTAISDLNYYPRTIKTVTCATSGTKTVMLDDQITVIGERINPTGKKRLKEALRNNQLDYLLSEAIDQHKGGAEILDINVGLPEIDEPLVLKDVVAAIQGVLDTPLQIDSVNGEAIEAALRIYNGKPIINSVNGKKSVMGKIFPIAKKYGAALIALTLDDEGIPETAEARVSIARKIIEEAAAYGIPREDIIVDCLVMTASAQQSMVKETLRAVSLVKRELGVKTTLGVSNVSYGLPHRGIINRTFLANALGEGLDAPILDPLSQEMMDTIRAYKVIQGLDKESMEYIQYYQEMPITGKLDLEQINDLKGMIIEGRKKEVQVMVEEALGEKNPLQIINEYFIPALDEVGRDYERGTYFLPQLLRAAEAVKTGLEVIKLKSLQERETVEMGQILLATVQGDIHDIGKNIVKMLLENYGYKVVDLGKDASPALILETVKQKDIQLVGLSALMTTTVKNMQSTIELLKKEAPQCKVMVGGAVLNPEYAKMIGADYYAMDAQAGVRIARSLFDKSKK